MKFPLRKQKGIHAKNKKVENLVPTIQSYINMEMKYTYAVCFTDGTSQSKNGGVKSNFLN